MESSGLWGWAAAAVVVLTNAIVIGVWKPFFASYASEKGKQLATREDITNVLEQLRAVTRETEQIKAEISGGVWKHQWLMGQRRDAYVRYIDALNAYCIALNDVIALLPLDDASSADAKLKVNAACDTFMREQSVLAIFCGDHIRAANDEINDRLAAFKTEFEASGRIRMTVDDEALLTIFVNAARRDLGVPPLAS